MNFETLKEIRDNVGGHWSHDAKSNAESLFSACSEFKFIMLLIVPMRVLNYAKAFTKKLQSIATDVVNE